MPEPLQDQLQGPEPLTELAEPLLHKLLPLGADETVVLCAEPHCPSMRRLALQLAFEPPFVPEQLQFHGPEPLTELADPLLQRPVVGFEVRPEPLDDPHCPLTGVGGVPPQLPPPPPLQACVLQLLGDEGFDIQ